jgi:ArsR family transcriptional regulator, virulence genes transcriptional regulator
MVDLLDTDKETLRAYLEGVEDASAFLKGLANPHRLMVLCLLCDGELSVGELEQALDIRQPTLSQQLARLRADGLVETRRDGKAIYYSLSDERASSLIASLQEMFCPPLK